MILVLKKNCSYSTKMKRYFNAHKISHVLIEVTASNIDGDPSYEYAKKVLKVKTFPMIISNGKRITGTDNIKAHLKNIL